MIPFINKLMTSVRNFGIMDFAIFKLFMVSAGIILGTYFSKFFLEYKAALWIVAAILCAVLLYRIHACRRG